MRSCKPAFLLYLHSSLWNIESSSQRSIPDFKRLNADLKIESETFRLYVRPDRLHRVCKRFATAVNTLQFKECFCLGGTGAAPRYCRGGPSGRLHCYPCLHDSRQFRLATCLLDWDRPPLSKSPSKQNCWIPQHLLFWNIGVWRLCPHNVFKDSVRLRQTILYRWDAAFY